MEKSIQKETKLSLLQAFTKIQFFLFLLSVRLLNAAAIPEVPLKVSPLFWGPLAAVGYQVASSSPLPSQQIGSRFIVFDVDKDGDQDLFYQGGSVSGAGISLKLNNGDGTYATPIAANSSGLFSSGPFSGITFTLVANSTLFPVDYDNDGDIDLFEPANNSTGRVLVNNNGTSFSVAATSPLPSQQFGSRFIIFDVDKDGDQDLFYQSGSVSGAGINLKLNNGDGTYAAPIAANSSGLFSSGPFNGITFTLVANSTLFPVDYDNDGDIDLFEPANNSTGRVLVNNNGTSFSVAATSPLPSQQFGSRFVVLDADADGDKDIFYQSGSVSGAGINLKLNNGDGTYAAPIAANSSGLFSSGPFSGITFTLVANSLLFPVDYDNDGDMDLFEPANNTTGRVIKQNEAPPKLASTTPADNASNVNPSSDLILTFDKSVIKGAKNIYIIKVSDKSVVETIALSSAQVTGSGSTWTVNPASNLADLTAYAIKSDPGTFKDADNRVFMGISNLTFFNFTTGVSNRTPTDITLSNSTIAENQPAETVVGTLSTTDPDAGQTYVYSLVTGNGSADNSSFKIVNNELRIVSPFNFETKTSYLIRVRSTDNGTPAAFFEKQFTITITNVNENPSVANVIPAQNAAKNTNYSFLIPANTFTDPETPTQLTLSVTGLPPGLTFTSPATISGKPTSASGSAFTVNVTATDPGNLFVSTSFVITITPDPLPVRLISFKAQNQDDQSVRLSWQTSLEENSASFEIQRSSDAKTFDIIGEIEAQGESIQSQSYIFDDKQALGQIGYYRLRMIDKDGSYAFSSIVSVENDVVSTKILILGNPVKNSIDAIITSPAEQNIEISLQSGIGQQVYFKGSFFRKGDTTIHLNTSRLSSGIYYLVIKDNIQKSVKRIFVN